MLHIFYQTWIISFLDMNYPSNLHKNFSLLICCFIFHCPPNPR